MNTLEIKTQLIPSGYETKVFFIDGKPLYEYIIEWLKDKKDLLYYLKPVDDLEVCWTDDYDFEGNTRFMRFVLNQDKAITPILSCPDDFEDFTCILIVADVYKQEKLVHWRKIGSVKQYNTSFEEEKRSGILYTSSYSEEDWKKYGNNIALENVDSSVWSNWISENWSEELYRRRKNYTFPYIQNEKNIDWFSYCDFTFNRDMYEKLIENCFSRNEISG